MDDFQVIKTYVYEKYNVDPKPHQIMSWLIVQSQPFKDFIEELVMDKIIDWNFTPADVDLIARYIIGFQERPSEKFLADMINGPMDADKSDYLVRDAYFAGPTVAYNLERFLHTLDIIPYPRDTVLAGGGEQLRRLSIRIEGVTALEQIIISKLMLFSYVYHHHKIRCVEAMFHEALERLVILGMKKPEDKVKPWLGYSTAFLRASDRTLLPLVWPLKISIPGETGQKVAGELLTKLAKQELYKHAP